MLASRWLWPHSVPVMLQKDLQRNFLYSKGLQYTFCCFSKSLTLSVSNLFKNNMVPILKINLLNL